jgi:N-ethylmaleimide reductase
MENRFRFLKEVVEALLKVWPADRVGVRLAPNGIYNDMGSPDFRETFLYVAEKLNDYNLAYLHILDGLALGFHKLGEPMKLSEFRAVFHGTLIGNCGYTKETAEEAIEKGDADLIAFGRPFISNPDLVERFANNWPLNPPADIEDWYSFTEDGYTTFPFYEPAKVRI